LLFIYVGVPTAVRIRSVSLLFVHVGVPTAVRICSVSSLFIYVGVPTDSISWSSIFLSLIRASFSPSHPVGRLLPSSTSTAHSSLAVEIMCYPPAVEIVYLPLAVENPRILPSRLCTILLLSRLCAINLPSLSLSVVSNTFDSVPGHPQSIFREASQPSRYCRFRVTRSSRFPTGASLASPG
jgi:hypothetical protein